MWHLQMIQKKLIFMVKISTEFDIYQNLGDKKKLKNN